ncbi:pentraxin-related protein PTX3-like [Mustelus asterias]
MLEDSQMRQNMLLHAIEEVLAGELKGIRSELRRGLAETTGACGLTRQCPADIASSRLAKQLLEIQNQATLKWHLESAKKLQEVFLLVLGLHDRLGALEEQLEEPGPSGAIPGKRGLCPALTEELRQIRAELRALGARGPAPHSETRSQDTPAGCQRALTFTVPLRGRHAIILPTDNRNLLAFTACVWAKPSHVTNETVLFAYCPEGNGTKFQLSLSRSSIQFSVDATELRGYAGPLDEWTHYCGIWDGGSRNATLVVGGQAVTWRSLRAGPRIIPGGGAVQLGHRNAECQGGQAKAPTSFAGKMTGFNLWDSAIAEMEVGRLLGNNGCDVKGNMVGWNVSPVTVGTGVLFH